MATLPHAMNEPTPTDQRLRTLRWLIAAQALMTLLAGVNLVWPWTKTALAAGEFVR